MCDTVNSKFYTTTMDQYLALVDIFSLVPPPPPPPPPELGVSIVDYGETVQNWQSEHLLPALKLACD